MFCGILKDYDATTKVFIANIYTNELGSYVEFWFLALKMNTIQNRKFLILKGGYRATFISDYLIFYIAILHQVIALFLKLVFLFLMCLFHVLIFQSLWLLMRSLKNWLLFEKLG